MVKQSNRNYCLKTTITDSKCFRQSCMVMGKVFQKFPSNATNLNSFFFTCRYLTRIFDGTKLLNLLLLQRPMGALFFSKSFFPHQCESRHKNMHYIIVTFYCFEQSITATPLQFLVGHYQSL